MLTSLQSRLKKAGQLLSVALLPFVAHAQVPTNDECATATALTVSTTCTPITSTNDNATASAGAPAPGINCFPNSTTISNDVWYTAVVPANGALTVTTSAVTGSPVDDTSLIMYSGTCAALTEVGCNDDISSTDYFSSATVTGLTAGTTVYIRVWSYDVSATGQFGICATSPAGAVCGDPTTASIGNATTTSMQITFTPGAGNVSYNVTYTAAGGTVQTLTPAPTSSPITITGLTPGTSYTVTLQSVCAGGSTGAVLTGAVTTTGGTVPTNDNPTGAVSLPVASTCTPVSGTNAGATTTPVNGYTNGTNPNAACGIAANPKDVWYKFTTAASGAGSTAVTITVTGAPAGYLRMFSSTSGAPGPFTEIACASGGTNNMVSVPLSIITLTPSTTYYVFVSGFGSSNAQGAFTICVTSIPANDDAVRAIYTLGTVSNYASPVAVQAAIKNMGTSATSARTATLTVSGATTFTSTQPVPAIAVGAVATITFPSYLIAATTGTNTITVTLSADDMAANNTATTQQTLTTNTLSYNDPSITTFTGGFGSNSTTVTTATFYVKYHTNTTPTSVRAVTPIFQGTTTASNNYQVLILATTASGTPGAVLYTSPARVRPRAGGADVVAVTPTPVTGDFFVAVRQLSTTNIGLAYQTESPLRLASFYASNDGTNFTDLSVAGVTFRPAITATLTNPLATRNDALAATVSLYPNPAHRSFTLTLPAGSLTTASASLLNTLGQVVQTRQLSLPVAGGSAEFNVSSLAAGVYSLQLKSGNDMVVKRVVVE